MDEAAAGVVCEDYEEEEMRLIDADALEIDMVIEEAETPLMPWYPSHMPMRKTLGVSIEQIDNAPTIDAVPRWIPCEERLPEKEKPYHRRDFFLTTNAYGAVNVTTYEFENDFQKRGWQSDIRIIAWMPLPEPYEEERRNNETD